MRTALLLVTLCIVACSSAEDEKAKAVRVATAGIAAESAKAAAAAALPKTGKWDESSLIDRLVHAGLAPRAGTAANDAPKFWNSAPTAIQLGDATLTVYFYPDSLARHAVTDALDSTTVSPKGAPSSYALPRLLILNNNLAAVLVGGSDRSQERVMLAISAGIASR